MADASGAARTALARGQSCLQAGEKIQAIRWLERAHRLAPRDAASTLLLASALAGVDEPHCLDLLQRLLSEHADFREARIALSAAELRSGDPDGASRRLADVLTSCTPPEGAGFRQLADRLARACGAPGWVGADSRGRMQLSLVMAVDGIEVALDGTLLRSLAQQSGGAGSGTRKLPPAWRTARRLTANWRGQKLLGSGIDLAALRRVQGFVQLASDGGLEGWAWHPGDPDATPVLRLIAQDSARGTKTPAVVRIRADDATLETASQDGTALLRGFAVPPSRLPGSGSVRVVGPEGADITGSPIFPFAEQRASRNAAAVLRKLHPLGERPIRDRPPAPDAWRPLPIALAAPAGPGRGDDPPRRIPPRRPVDIIVPVYRGAADFIACLASLRRGQPSWSRLVVVDDAAPDPALRAAVEAAAERREIILLRHPRNLGFPAAANTGMRYAAANSRTPRDVVLLNADTLLPIGWLERLVDAGYAAGETGSVTPMTNDGTIVAYPSVTEVNSLPDLAGTDGIDARLRAANGRRLVELPTAVGFCMFIRHDCLADVGVFREDAFAQGYGEENDWSLRARHLGWKHMAATGIFVGHVGGGSFGPAKRQLMARNRAVLNRLHPGYDAMIADFIARDPLAPARFRADVRKWRQTISVQRAVILITHASGGGVERYVAERCATLRAEGRRAIILRPDDSDDAAPGWACRLSDGDEQDYPNLRFRLPRQVETLWRMLQAARPERVEIHHLLGHAPDIVGLLERFDLPYDVFIHDYALWCPRITLCTKGPRYCGEPIEVEVCEACVRDVGRRTSEDIPVAQMRANSALLLKGARRVVVSCDDVAGRMARHFRGVRTTVLPWEDDAALRRAAPVPALAEGRQMPWRVLVVGAIGADKGYDVLLGCVRDAARRALNLSFIVVGYTMDDSRLLEAGPIFITGEFEEAEATDLARAQHADLGFVPSICPETWCYALSTLWRAGLRAAAFAFGAQAQRITRSGRGVLLPVGLTPERINDALIACAADGAREG